MFLYAFPPRYIRISGVSNAYDGGFRLLIEFCPLSMTNDTICRCLFFRGLLHFLGRRRETWLVLEMAFYLSISNILA